MMITTKANEIYKKCIETCLACAEACEFCANACLNEPDPKAMARCIRLDRDCADMCILAAKFMARDSEFAIEICSLCAKICKVCGEECSRHPVDHCRNCEEICYRCAEECERMAR